MLQTGPIHKYFARLPGDKVKLFDVGSCPNCGSEVVEPNAVGCGNDPVDLIQQGFVERQMPTNELAVGDDGKVCCEGCNEE